MAGTCRRWRLCRRAHLVWHGGRSNFARNGALLEVPQADVRPHVSVKVQQDVIVARHCIKQLCNVVVRLDLHSQSRRSDEVNRMSWRTQSTDMRMWQCEWSQRPACGVLDNLWARPPQPGHAHTSGSYAHSHHSCIGSTREARKCVRHHTCIFACLYPYCCWLEPGAHLGDIGVPVEAQGFHKAAGHIIPCHIGVCRQVCVVVAHSARHLPKHLHSSNLRQSL